MNLYPLDGSVINGYDTLYVSGAAALALDTSGNALLAKLIAGTAALLMAGSGTAQIQGAFGGTAQLLMAGSGTPTAIQQATGTAALLMAGYGTVTQLQAASGAAMLEMFGIHGLPFPWVPPSTFTAAKGRLRVEPHPKPFIVRPEAKPREPRKPVLPRVGEKEEV